jgi:hypothetical protein
METHHPNYSTSKSKEEQLAEDSFINPLPRAVMRPNTPILLDGEWKFALDAEDKGLHDGWHIGHNYSDVSNWPGSIEEHIAAAKGQQETHCWQDKIVAWY